MQNAGTTAQTDYTNAKIAPVLICFVKHKNNFLLLKRSENVLAYRNLWSSLSGFIEPGRAVEDQILNELREELSCDESKVISISRIDTYPFFDAGLNRTWIRHIYLVELASEKITIDWEHSDYRWVTPGEACNLQTTPGFAEDFKKVLCDCSLRVSNSLRKER